MSKYTTEVRFICETEAGLSESVGYSSIEAVLNRAVPRVFSFNFPIFDERYRNVLCKKILKHYYTREICEETYGLWKLRLDTRMNEVMPYFNQLYESELIKFNPLYDVDVTRKGNKKNDNTDKQTAKSTTSGSASTNTNATSTGRDLYSDTPQGSLQNVDNETYLTNARKVIDEDKGSTTANSTQYINGEQEKKINSTEDYLETISGKHSGVSYSKMLMEYRDTFLNIDMQIIEKLSDLFFGLW